MERHSSCINGNFLRYMDYLSRPQLPLRFGKDDLVHKTAWGGINTILFVMTFLTLFSYKIIFLMNPEQFSWTQKDYPKLTSEMKNVTFKEAKFLPVIIAYDMFYENGLIDQQVMDYDEMAKSNIWIGMVNQTTIYDNADRKPVLENGGEDKLPYVN